MNKEIKDQFKSFFKDDIKKNKNYREFLSYLGIDPEDFEEEFDIEIDDYSK